MTFKKMSFLSFFIIHGVGGCLKFNGLFNPLKTVKINWEINYGGRGGDSYDSYNFLQQSFFAFSSLSLPQGFLAMNFVRTLGAITTIFFKIK